MLGFFCVIAFGIQAADAATTGASQETACYFMHGESAWTVQWQARTNNTDGAFLLYSGQDLSSLQIVDIQRATAGIASYRYNDAPRDATWLFYQVRFITTDGKEIVLGTLRVEIDGMASSPVTVDNGNRSIKALNEARPIPGLDYAEPALAEPMILVSGNIPEPEVPPPRSV